MVEGLLLKENPTDRRFGSLCLTLPNPNSDPESNPSLRGLCSGSAKWHLAL